MVSDKLMSSGVVPELVMVAAGIADSQLKPFMSGLSKLEIRHAFTL